MKGFLLITLLIFTAFMVDAQVDGSWKVKLNGKTILSTSIEDQKINTRKVSLTEWKKAGSLELTYLNSEPTWIRSFLFVDENDQELFKTDSTTRIKISLSKLRKLFAGKKQIIIYTVARPTNPDIMVRIRRVHLCTLKLP